jgi:hypothetical protein
LTIERLFCIVEPTGCEHVTPGDPKFVDQNAKQRSRVQRHTAMKRDSRSLLAVTVRTAITVALALILILVLLPAVLAAQAAGLR